MRGSRHGPRGRPRATPRGGEWGMESLFYTVYAEGGSLALAGSTTGGGQWAMKTFFSSVKA